MLKNNKQKNSTFLWIVILLIVAIGGYLTYTSAIAPQMEGSNDVEYIDEEISNKPAEGVTAGDVLDNPDMYEEMTITVRAEVEEWLSPRSFALDAPGVVNDNLLVITKEPTFIFEDPEIFGDAIWEVTGAVEQFEYATVVDTLDADLVREAFLVYEGRPFIVANSVEKYED